MELTIKYGKRFENNRIKSTLEKLDWFKSHGYKPIIPKNISTEKQIVNFIDKNFNEKDYEENKKKLLKEYKKIKKRFNEKLKSLFSNIPKEVEVILTKYGSGGSYLFPNKVIINIQGNQINKPLIDVLKHEILHLLSEEKIIRKKLSHEEKEKFIRKLEKD